jgi:hypothetical protein
MGMKTRENRPAKLSRLSAGRYRIGGTIIIRRAPKTGVNRMSNRQAVTWRNESTGEMMGYSLKEAAEMVRKFNED